MQWMKNPVIFEIATWVWLDELSAKYGQPITLANVPTQEWDDLGAMHVDAVWFMGVWDRSPAGIAIANENAGLQEDFRHALADYQPADNVGSAYCVRNYIVAEHLGGPEGLALARKELAARGLRLLLDFVPNHVAPDHPWVADHPDYFVQGSAEDAANAPREFFTVNGQVIANGRDPYFAPWPDVAQLNAFAPGLRAAVIATVNSIADQCDGMRCDMAMLLLNDIFTRTWGARAGERPATEYWQDVINAVRAQHPDVIFIAEAYWDLEWQLQQQGFDYCYDKRLYDRLVSENAASVRGHLMADLAYQNKLVRFIENHDEPRAAATFPPQKERAAAVVTGTLPGAKLYFDGQLDGRRVHLPVFLARRPSEPRDGDLAAFYSDLLTATHTDLMQKGEWSLCEQTGWSDNQSVQNLVAWAWRCENTHRLIVVNLSNVPSQANIRFPWQELGGRVWQLDDPLNHKHFERDGSELQGAGLYVDLGAWEFHFLNLE